MNSSKDNVDSVLVLPRTSAASYVRQHVVAHMELSMDHTDLAYRVSNEPARTRRALINNDDMSRALQSLVHATDGARSVQPTMYVYNTVSGPILDLECRETYLPTSKAAPQKLTKAQRQKQAAKAERAKSGRLAKEEISQAQLNALRTLENKLRCSAHHTFCRVIKGGHQEITPRSMHIWALHIVSQSELLQVFAIRHHEL